MLHRSFAISAALSLALNAAAESPVHVDLLVTNARIWTGEPKQPEAAVVGVFQGRIMFVRTSGEWTQLQKDGVEISARKTIDAKGNRIVPGFYDAHIHLLGGGQRLSQVALKDAKDEE